MSEKLKSKTPVDAATACSRERAFAWGIVSSGRLLVRSIRPTRKEAQDDMADLIRVPWKFLRAKCDYRCVKVWMSYRENGHSAGTAGDGTKNHG